MKHPRSISNLINFFSKLPTVGPKTAERYVFYLLKMPSEELQAFAQALAELKEKTTVCKSCLAISETDPCAICSDPKRNKAKLCVVSGSREMISIESTGEFDGAYHILGGVIDTIRGVKPENLNIKRLVEKVSKNQIKEVLLALSPNLEGETTSLYLSKLLKKPGLKITRLAKGLPMGADLEYADELTLSNALKYRNEL
jgi:recombination protein RecR